MTRDAQEEKQRFRARVRQSRRARSSEERTQAAGALAVRLSEITEGCGLIASYVAAPLEPETALFHRSALEYGMQIVVPASRPDGLLDWVELRHFDTADAAVFYPGAFGLLEPTGERLPPQTLGTVDLAVIPAAAVDRTGVRLGWGRGYYDRTLAALVERPRVVATVFDDELFAEIPREAHDAPVDAVVTPSETLRLTF